jgi:hypothetical protein
MRRRKLTPEELEREAGIERNVPRSPTQRDIRERERKILGRDWGKPRRKMEGWPK